MGRFAHCHLPIPMAELVCAWRRPIGAPLYRLIELQSSTASAFFHTAAVTTEDKGNAEVLTHSYPDCLGGGLCPFHLQGCKLQGSGTTLVSGMVSIQADAYWADSYEVNGDQYVAIITDTRDDEPLHTAPMLRTGSGWQYPNTKIKWDRGATRPGTALSSSAPSRSASSRPSPIFAGLRTSSASWQQRRRSLTAAFLSPWT